MANTLTAANSILLLSIGGLFDVPQQLQGFSADDVTDTESVTPAEISMGVDAKMSAGWVAVAVPQNITLQGDSLSNLLFEKWYQAQLSIKELYYASGSIMLPSTGRKYNLTKGVLTSMPVTPQVRRIIQPRRYTVTWESVTSAAF